MRENIIEQLRFCASRFSCEGCIGECKTSSNEPRTKAVLNDAADAIEELLAAVPHWISVKDALPECGVPVLVCADNIKKHPAEQVCGVDVFDGNVWEQASKDWKYVPTNWMPLPKAPMEVE